MGLFDDILASDKPAGSGAVTTAPRSGGLFDEVLGKTTPKNEPKLSPELQIDKEAIGIGSQIGSSLGRTVVGMPGAIGSLANMWGAAGDKLRENGYLPPIPKDSFFAHRMTDSEDVAKWAEKKVPGLSDYIGREPTNAGERAASVVGSFLAGPTNGVRGAVVNQVVPAVVTAGVNEAAHQGALPQWAVPAAAIASNVLAHGAAHVVAPQSAAKTAIGEAFRGVSNDQLNAAESLMNDAGRRGVNLTWAEALQQVTGGATNGANLQRVVEGQGGLRDFMGRRPAEIEAANREMFNSIAETPNRPSAIGPQVGEAATGAINDQREVINTTTRPAYQRAEQDLVSPADMQRLQNSEVYNQALAQVRNDPSLNMDIQHLPDNSAVTVDRVKTQLGHLSDQALSAINPTGNHTSASAYQRTADLARNVATGASSDLSGALHTQTVLRNSLLAPLEQGPIGKLAKQDLTTQNAINALFPQNPLANSAAEITDAVSRLSQRNPWAARQVVRAHVEGTFNQAAKELQSGANEFGGASFRAKLIGNPQAAENLYAAIDSLPHGKQIRQGFDRMMEIMEATGQRQRVGSQTAFNQEALAGLKNGSIAGEAIATGGLKLPQRIREKYQAWNMGRNVDELARLLTDRNSADQFKRLALAGNDPNQIAAALRRIYSFSARSSRNNQLGQQP